MNIHTLGPLPETSSGSIYLLIVCDRFSNFIRAIPLRIITALDVTSAFCEYCTASYGPLDSVFTGNSPQFASVFFQGVRDLMGIKNLFTTTYNPQTNGQVERLNPTLVEMLRHHVEEHQEDWAELRAVLTLSYNSRVHRATGVARLEFVDSRQLTNLSRKGFQTVFNLPQSHVSRPRTCSWNNLSS